MLDELEITFDLSEGAQFDALFEIYAAGTVWGTITGTLSDQTDLQDALDLKADKTELNTAIQNEATTRAENDTLLQNNINTLSQTVTDNNTAINNRVDGVISAFDNEIETINTNLSDLSDIVSDNYTDLDGKISDLTDTVNDNDTAINNKVDGINTTLTNSINSLSNTVTSNYTTLDTKIDNTKNALDSDISDLSNTVTSNYNSLDARITTNTDNIATNAGNITTINSKIPNQASSSNQLADKDFVNSSIATNTANFIGTFNSVAELEAYTGTLTNNDYAFVATTDAAGNTLYDRYKYNADTQEWLFEYELNNSSFTAQQWAAINSGATSTNIGQITINANNIAGLQTNKQDVLTAGANIQINNNVISATDTTYTAGTGISIVNGIISNTQTSAEWGNIQGTLSNQTDLQNALNAKQSTISDLSTIRSGAALGATALQPNDNITELTNNAGYITSSALAPYAKSADLATVATSGSYNDLTNKPTIPAAQVNSDWNASSGVAQILNKPTLATVATSGSYNDLSNKPTIPSEVTESTVSGWGFTKNTGTVTSVNNISPVNGNITLTIPDTSNLANKDLSNLSIDGNSRLHALKGYEDTGELLTDAEGLADANYYARSTFDRSKFTVVGSPSITDDGIASGFSSSKYITTQSIDFSSQNFGIEVRINGNILSGLNYGYFFSPLSFEGGVQLYRVYSNLVLRYCTNTNNTFANHDTTLLSDFETGKFYNVSISIKGLNINVIVTKENGTIITEDITATDTIYFPTATAFIIGARYTNSINAPCQGTIDLKGVNITVDGLEVFSGNKTGIDTIKPDDYNVVGTPTISADGIASGFSTNNYINSGINSSIFAHPFNIYFKFNSSNVNSRQSLIGLNTAYGMHINIVSSKIRLGLSSNGTSLDIANNIDSTLTINTNQDYIGRLTWSGSVYNVDLLINNIWVNYISVTNSSAIIAGHNLLIGIVNNAYPLVYGSIDLNAFKIYVDGNLVYQSCLKIPYTESKTGSKIVQSVYRDRVSDMYNQFGYAPYYTLSDTDFTLPMGEVYGMYEKYRKHTLSDVMPDWSKAVSKVVGTTYTADQRGWIQAQGSTTQNGINISINGYVVAYCEAQGSDDTSGFGCLVPVDIGDEYSLYQSGGVVYQYNFIPCKGEE